MPRALRTPALQAPPRDPRHPPVPAAPTSGVGRWRARCPGGTGGWDVKWSSERVQVIFWRWKNWKSWEFFSMGAATLLLLLLLLIIIIIIIILLLRVHSLIQPSCGPFKPSMAATAPRNGSIWPTSPLCASAGWESFVLFRLEIRKAALWHPKITKSWLGFNGNTCGFRMKMFDFFLIHIFTCFFIFTVTTILWDIPLCFCWTLHFIQTLQQTAFYLIGSQLLEDITWKKDSFLCTNLHQSPKLLVLSSLQRKKMTPLGSLGSAPLARARSMGFVVQSFYSSIILSLIYIIHYETPQGSATHHLASFIAQGFWFNLKKIRPHR